MNKTFRTHVQALQPLVRKLTAMKPVTVATLPSEMPNAGIYLFSVGRRPLYVGRTNRLRQRLQEHCRPKSKHNSASFAFLLAREATGLKKATYVARGSRASLEKRPKFRKEFSAAKDRVREMDVRFVAEDDPIRQALLEMYAALELKTKYNDFDNH